MRLTVRKPQNTIVKGSVVLCYERAEYDANGQKKKVVLPNGREETVKHKVTRKVKFGETFDEDEQTGFEVIAKYEGLVVQYVEAKHHKAMAEAPLNRMLKDEAVK